MMGKDWMLMWIKCIAAQCNCINNIHVCIAWLRWQSNLWVKFVHRDTVLSSTLNICYTKNDNAKSETYLTVSIYVPGEIDWAFSIIIIRINKNEKFENIMIIMLWTNRKISISNININKNCLYFLRVVHKCWVVYHLGCVRYFRLLYTRVFEFPRYIICKTTIWNTTHLKETGLYKSIVSTSLC